ncbi:MAG: hydantoinase/oxoprolinase N-terminal domain-containing protein, partial [Actinomycetota bacterium]|nr:hydantoinase/oxoprolinase N-terminal domain-containing protein [Actinomycetota bacterium]
MKDLSLGIDTGGTFTDALIYCNRTQAVLGKAKTPTTHDDLSSCVSTALASVLETSAVDPHEIAVVSVSTTLATNALVEDSGRPAGLVTIGFNDEVFNR